MPSSKKVFKDLQKADKVITGSLLAVGGVQIGKFISEAARWGRGSGEFARNVFYLVPTTGGQAKGGRLSMGMAQSAKYWIAEILGNHDGLRHKFLAGVFTPYSESEQQQEYVEWKHRLFPGKVVGTLTGATSAAVGVLRQAGGSVVVGLQPSFRSVPPMPYADPLSWSKKATVPYKYWPLHEFGSMAKYKPIPLMSAGMLSWLQKNLPQWAPTLRDLFHDIMQKPTDKESEAIEAVADKWAQEEKQHTIVTALYDENTNQVKIDIARKQSSAMETLAKKVEYYLEKALKAKQLSTNHQAMFRQAIVSMLVGEAGFKADRAHEIVDATLSGQEIDIDWSKRG